VLHFIQHDLFVNFFACSTVAAFCRSFLCLNFFVGRFCAVTFLVCVEFEVLLMPYSVVLGLSPFTVCLVLASSLSRAAAAISFLRACF